MKFYIKKCAKSWNFCKFSAQMFMCSQGVSLFCLSERIFFGKNFGKILGSVSLMCK